MLSRFARLKMPVRGAVCLSMLAAVLLLSGCPDAGSPSGTQAKAPQTATAPALTATAGQSQTATAASPVAYRLHDPQNAAQASGQTPAQSAAMRQLISDAEGAYQSGFAHYRANQMDAARTDFDRAVDLMLTSPLDVRGTPELSDEFDKIIEGINALETASLQQGESLTPQVEISPAEAANDVTFPVDPNLRAQAEAELKTTQSDLPLVINDAVASFISYFTNNRDGRAHLARSLERAGRYREIIQRILREEGVPQDLIYQAVAESGFQPQAVNGHSGAGGMWQFMPGTGALYGLTRNGYVDERFEPERATRAYAKYMHDMYNQLGDWYLVMAGYDWGPGAVQHAVSKTGYADFWELYRRNNLPAETKNYVPIILAAVIIAKNPAQYGFTDLKPLPPLAYDVVTTHQDVNLRLVADLTGSHLEDIVELNPGLLRLSTPRDNAYDLHVPPGTKDLFTTRLAQIPEDHRDSWRFHTVAAGESLTDIAHTYHSEPGQIAGVNQVTGDSLEEGQGLIIPVAAAASLGSSRAAATHYTTRKGDSVVSVADRFGVSATQLRTWNHLKGNTLPPGHMLLVASPAFSRGARRSSGKHSSAGHASPGHTSSGHAAATGAAHKTASKGGAHTAASGSHGKATSGKTMSGKAGANHGKTTASSNHAGSGKASKPVKKKQ
jgi:membrane-bound lytic murein transglycosylase D